MLSALTQQVLVKTTCPYCGVGCGVAITPTEQGTQSMAVAGDSDHPSNFGKLCVKGSALGETIGLEGRLLAPQIRNSSSQGLEETDWNTALSTVATTFADIIAEHGPDSVALYVSGQLLTEDYYVANKWLKGWVGTANIDTNSRLCMSSAVAGHVRAFGEDIVPVSYADLESADLIVLVGSNTAWCHPIMFQRIIKAKEARPELKIVVLDPRRTATCELADLHLPLKPGSDVAVFNGLLQYLYQHGIVDANFVQNFTIGATAALKAAEAHSSMRAVSKTCGVDPSLLEEFYRLFARTEKVITAFSMGVNQSSAGTDKVNSIINAHLLTGRIGRVGTGPFSITGQPNAMGGREVGGLANMLAAHLNIADPNHRQLAQDFWKSPTIAEKAGLKAVDLFNAIEAGTVKAVWIMATNPVVSLPNANQVKAALQKCQFVVTSDIVYNDTTAFAHVVLPALGWGEKDGTVTNSERRISRQRAFLPAPGNAQADWWALSQVATRMGASGFAYNSAAEIFDEFAQMTAYRNHDADIPRYLNLRGLVGLDAQQYQELMPQRWPILGQEQPHVFADGRYYHADRKARLVPVSYRAPANRVGGEFPMVLNTGRVRDHWHTMTRTGRAPTLASHTAEPYVDIHPQDALLCGVRDGTLARVTTEWGSVVVRIKMSGEMPRGSVFMPIHWNDQFASDARVGALVNPAVDPISGEPEFKHTPVRVEEFRVNWHGFALSRTALEMDAITWWTRMTGKQFLRYEMAGRGKHLDWPTVARTALSALDTDADWLEYEDRTAGVYRAALVVNDRIEACVFISPRADLPSRAWLAGLFEKPTLDEMDRIGLLVGEPLMPEADAGPTVCSCFGVGRNVMMDAIKLHDLKTPKAVTACLKAGGNCGSCVPEIKKLIAECIFSEA